MDPIMEQWTWRAVRRAGRSRRLTALALAAAVVVQVALSVPASALPRYGKGERWTPPHTPTAHAKPVPRTTRPGRPGTAARASSVPGYRAPALRLPPAGTSVVPIDGSRAVQVPNSPVWLVSAAGTRASVRVSFAAAAVAQQAHVWSGLMLGVTRADAAAGSGRMRVQLDTAALAGASGGNYAQRLRLVQLPACALTTPERPECQTSTPVPATPDASTGRLSATLTATGATTVLAAASAPAGSAGTYGATSVKPSDQWSAGGATGNFGYSYPVPVPPSLGGSAPAVSLSYSSASVDGLTASANAQSSWVGSGWDYDPGYIERAYQPCSDDGLAGSGDTCWAYGGLQVSLGGGGKGGQLVYDSGSKTWHLSNDDGSKIELLTSGTNGAYQGEYWRITAQDGTRYYYGAGHLPAAEGGKGTDPASNSAWTQPVYCPKSADPCYNASTGTGSFAPSMAYRWNLDYVVDRFGNTTVYRYGTESNYYSRSSAHTLAPYVRAGYLQQISYGWLASDVAAQADPKPAARVVFTTAQRCTGSATECASVANLTKSTAKDWPDTPADLICPSTGTCANTGMSYFSTVFLSQIQTEVNTSAGYKPVDTYALAHTFPDPGDASSPSPWLSSVTHTGHDGGDVTLPAVSFLGAMLANRVPGSGTWPDYKHERITDITTETGGHIQVNYADSTPSIPECNQSATNKVLPSPTDNGMLCYQQYWTAPGQANPSSDWFLKYVVTQVELDDAITATGYAASPTRITRYDYGGVPAWHRDDSVATKNAQRSWNQFRGFGQVTTTTGVAPDPVTQTRVTYLRGMNGDYTSQTGGTRRAVTTADSLGDTVTDDDAYADNPLETDTYDKAGGAVVAKSVDLPWTATTATQAQTSQPGLPALVARFVATGTTKTAQLKSDGTWRTTQTVNVHSPTTGLLTQLDEQGDTSLAGGPDSQELCSTTAYATPPASGPNTGIVNSPARVTTVSVRNAGPIGTAACPAPTADNTVSDTLTTYDGNSRPGVLTSRGATTQTQVIDSYGGGTASYATTMSAAAYDAYGRLTAGTDAHGVTTTTSFTPSGGTLPTGQAVTNVTAGWTTTTILDQLRQLPTSSTDLNGLTTTQAYDGLGRLTKVWLPGRATGKTASIQYLYSVSGSSAAPYIRTWTLRDDNTYAYDFKIFDGFGQARQEQHVSLDGSNGTLVSDTFYDSHGWPVKISSPYYETAFPTSTLYQAADANVPAQTLTTYDGQGRAVASTFVSYAQPQWKTTTAYVGADRTDVTPPSGGTATSTFTDALGRTTALWRYTTPTPDGNATHAQAISYQYTPAGKPSTVSGPSGQQWEFGYDLQGHRTSTKDPDAGTSTATYDAAGDLTSTTDARHVTLAYQYDNLGRKIGEYLGSTGGTQLAGWTYDTAAGGKGQPATSVAFRNGAAITRTVAGYTNKYAPTGTSVTIPAGALPNDEAKLAGTYSVSTDYVANSGLPAATTYGADGGLPAEQVSYSYDQNGNLAAVGGAGYYLDSTLVDPYGRVNKWWLGTMPYQVVQTNVYDTATGRATNQYIDKETGDSHVDAISTLWNQAGLISASQDVQDGTATDLQCYAYNQLGQLAEAWTDNGGTTGTPAPSVPNIGGCANSTPSASKLGGPATYWQSYEYDLSGNRTKMTDHSPDGDASRNLTHEYSYAGGGPDALSKVTNTGPVSTVDTYTYDEAGNTATRSIGGDSKQQFTYTPENQTATATDSVTGNTASYLYDSDGALLIQRDHTATATTATLYLAGEQLTLDVAGQALTGLRYYDTAGGPTVVRASTGTLTYEIGNPQGTGLLTIDAGASQAQTRRYFTPYGAPRGPATAQWVDNHAFLNQPADDATGLDLLGARNYEPANGRFLQADPVLETADPNQLGGYTYAADNPVNGADPTGTMLPSDGGTSNTTVYCEDHCGGSPEDEAGKTIGPPATYDPPADAPQPKPKHKHWWDKATHWVSEHKAEIAGFVAGGATFLACEALTEGAGTIGCMAAAGAVANLTSDAVSGNIHNIGDALKSATVGAVQGAFAVPLAVVDGIHQVGTIASDIKHGNYMGALGHGALFGLDALTVVDGARGPRAGRGGCHSFASATLVLLADGTTKPIQNIKLGDQVASTDPDSGTTSAEPVVALHDNHDSDLADVTVQDAKGKTTVLHTTWHHPFWNDTANTWTDAEALHPGDQLHTRGNDPVRVVSIHLTTHVQDMHDLTVATTHTYYVLAGTTPVLVHNSSCGIGAKRGPKPAGTGPHNLTIASVGQSVTDGEIIAGGGVLPERAISTPGGFKGSRRPDILVERPDGSQYGINVGKQAASGAPVKREAQAISDLEGAGIEMHFVPYN